MAEGIFRGMLKKEEIENIDVSSAGLAAMTGDTVSQNAVKAAQKFGCDISKHVSRALNSYLLIDTDLFVCMTNSQRISIASAIGAQRVISLDQDISDPFGQDEEKYYECANEIYEALKNLLEKIKHEKNVVPMQEKHIKDVALLEKECFTNPWSEKSLREELENENAHFLVCIKDGELIGYIGVQSICGECYITNVAVKESMRKQGIATALLDRTFRDAILRNDEFITLEARKSNSAAISLYSKFGFKIEGERKNFYTSPKEDAHIMTLKLRDKK